MEISPEQVASLRAQLWAGKYRPVPVYSNEKRPLGNDWLAAALKDPPDCIRLGPVPHALNTGLLCRGLYPIDHDIDELQIADLCRQILFTMFPSAPWRFRGNSGRFLALFRSDIYEHDKITLIGERGRIEVLGKGNQFVTSGIHPSGEPYRWAPEAPQFTPLLSLPLLTEEQLLSYLTMVAPIIGAPLPRKERSIAAKASRSSYDGKLDPYVASALTAEVQKARLAPEGDRNNQLNKSAFALGQFVGAGHLDRSTVEQELAAAAREAGLEGKEIERTIKSGIDDGMTQPREIPERTNGYDTSHLGIFSSQYKSSHYEQAKNESEGSADYDPETGEVKPEFAATPLNWDEMEAVGPREWVYGHFLIRRFISMLGAPGGTGKTAYAFTIGLSVVTNKELLGEKVHESGNLWIYNLEDPKDELLRRFRAACIHYNISRSEIEGRVFLDSGRDRPLVIAVRTNKGGVIATPVVEPLIDEIKRRQIKLFIPDPFVRTHQLEENVNDQMDFAAAQWAYVADKADCSIMLVHHFRKGGNSGDASAFRGASAVIDASRAAISLSTMSEEEATKRFNIPAEKRWQYIRADNAKLNLAPPPEEATWFKLVGEDLGNAIEGRASDKVQSIERYNPPTAYEGMEWPTIVHVLKLIDAGPGGGEYYALAKQSVRWAGDVLITEAGRAEAHAKKILKDWKESGVLIEGKYASPRAKGAMTGCVRVDHAKVAEMKRNLKPEVNPDD